MITAERGATERVKKLKGAKRADTHRKYRWKELAGNGSLPANYGKVSTPLLRAYFQAAHGKQEDLY
jgi:hypothetical protein